MKTFSKKVKADISYREVGKGLLGILFGKQKPAAKWFRILFAFNLVSSACILIWYVSAIFAFSVYKPHTNFPQVDTYLKGLSNSYGIAQASNTFYYYYLICSLLIGFYAILNMWVWRQKAGALGLQVFALLFRIILFFVFFSTTFLANEVSVVESLVTLTLLMTSSIMYIYAKRKEQEHSNENEGKG